jgi:hypothetical protein
MQTDDGEGRKLVGLLWVESLLGKLFWRDGEVS